MYFVVILVKSKKLLALPASHIFKLDVVRKINFGLRNWRNQLVFFSSKNHDPNFSLAIREDFDENVDGIYWANVLRAFDTMAHAERYLELRRRVLPVNYSGQPAEQDSLDEIIGGEFGIDFESDIKRQPIRLDSDDAALFPSDVSVCFGCLFGYLKWEKILLNCLLLDSLI